MKKLENFHYRQLWTTHIACIDSCQHFLGLGHSTAWVFGATGHAFIINMHDELCASGPTAWKTEMLFQLVPNLGCEISGVFAEKKMPDFNAKQEKAWEHVKKAIDSCIPCYGWELLIPEFYLIAGYDDVGYLRDGCCPENGPGPTPWRELGTSEIGVLDVMSVRRGTVPNDRKTVKDALLKAVRHATNPPEWIFPGYSSGPRAYDAWIAALEKEREYGQAEMHGAAYNAAVWSECRVNAVKFLKEAKARIPGMDAEIDKAMGHYVKVRNNLEEVAMLFPFNGRKLDHIRNPGRREKAIQHLAEAKASEIAGLDAIENIAKKI